MEDTACKETCIGLLKPNGMAAITNGNKHPEIKPSLLQNKICPNEYLWKKIESLIDQMVSDENGIPVRNIKSFLSVIPSVFRGTDIVKWLIRNMSVDDIQEAIHLASRISSHGYLFCIDEHNMTVKNDSHTYYRFQTPCFYPSRCLLEVDSMDYAVYLCKRTMQNKQRLELVDYEAERLASLQHHHGNKWEFIYMQAEAEAKIDKKRDKLERLVLESQERAYWDLYMPAPGCVNTTEVDMKKLARAKRPKREPSRPNNFPVPSGPGGQMLYNTIESLSASEQIPRLVASSRIRIRSRKAIENLLNYTEQYSEVDLLLSAALMPATQQVTGSGDGAVPSLHVERLSATGTGGFQISRTSSASAMNMYSTNTTLAPETSNTQPDVNGDILSVLNPWICDNPEYWNGEQTLPSRRVKRWSFSIYELIRDPIGRNEFLKWLEREFSAENLRFWEACQRLKSAPLKEVPGLVEEIYAQFLAPNASELLNVDNRVGEAVRKRVCEKSSHALADRYCFEDAEDHIFQLMKSDSYCRFLRSEVYRDFFSNSKKKSKKHRSGVSISGQVNTND
ncbi:Regulator of G-protein signaling 7 [Cichlidogyrus casuarinus]|uniref:Regulator of G-protein signaling 7 n=1 Tax=Cichlidogyrus casuarinus TaxID=1844966 RepID=A0ABD2Q3U0_9PLAT